MLTNKPDVVVVSLEAVVVTFEPGVVVEKVIGVVVMTVVSGPVVVLFVFELSVVVET